ncbi:MAG TPA: ABC transporter substrate-binding protein, partial [Dehalococcoidia bacterium]|nr:ABC transporter substrate-binding protein [Dehalococcoidia bacterium]
MQTGYWSKFTQDRLSRRRVVTGAAGLGLSASALALLGCGDDNSSEEAKAPADKSGLVHTPKDTTSQAKAGGILKHYLTADINHFDATADPSGLTVGHSAEPFYPRMLRMKSVKATEAPEGSQLGEAAESWEMSPDKLQLTFKLRQGMKWDNRAPTNGRALDANDIVFAWTKFSSVNAAALSIVYNANAAPDAPVESIRAADDKTIVVKLKQPNASILPMFSARDIFYITPKEADGGFDPRKTVRGHGPYILEDYIPSARFVYAKNPNFYIKDRPFPDKVEVPIVSDQAQRLAQFKAGNIYTDVVAASQENVVVTKRDVPETLLLQAGNFPETSSLMLTFGWEQGVPFRDQRARQALSMMIDREAYIDVLDNRENFRKEGLELPVRRNAVVAAGWGDFWLDPTSEKDFGPNAKYLNLDLAEAKKLMAAAGFASGFEFDFNYAGGGQYGNAYNKTAELLSGMFINGGLRPKLSPVVPADRWLDVYARGYRSKEYAAGKKPGFTGIGLIAERTYPTLAVQLYNQFHKDGQAYRGMLPQGGVITEGDPKLSDLASKIAQEFDRAKQKGFVHELIRYATGQSYYIPRISSAKAYSLWWPAVGNVGAFVSDPGAGNWVDLRLNWWVD